MVARAAVKGWVVSVAQEGARYDLVLDNGLRLYRAQVKWAGEGQTPGTAVAALRSWAGNGRAKGRGKQRRYADGEIDALLAYVPATDQICWFEGEHLAKACVQVRYLPTANGQRQGILYAASFA